MLLVFIDCCAKLEKPQMVFNSFSFWIVFPFIFGLYWLIPVKYNHWRKLFLVIVSYLLYMNWKPAFALVLLGVTLVTYWGGQVLQSEGFTVQNVQESERLKRNRLVWLFAILGLQPLLAFKYYNFLNDSLTGGLASIGLKFAMPGLNWAVPIGISFFTFQAVGYMLDVYHGRVKAEKNLLDYILFVSFFPQITSGPISTAKELMPQIKVSHSFSYEQGRDGLKLLLWGMFVKVVIADRVGMLVDTVYGNYQFYSGNICMLASFFYTIQIYCDFAGYSWMAIGIAKTLGFDLINNFRQPYFATSITDFWKRWHISLTRWLTTHVYIGLGGNRCSKLRLYWNIMVTFLVSGLWHGANWTFVFWGFIHGILQIIEKILGIDPKGRYSDTRFIKSLSLVRVLVTFILVNIAWIFFRMPTIGDAFDVIGKMVHDRGSLNIVDIYTGSAPVFIVIVGILLLVLHDLVKECGLKWSFLRKPVFQWCWFIILFILIMATGVLDGGQFIYASF